VLLVDTNIWLAAADRRSRDHDACRAVLAGHAGQLAAPVPVIAETAWLLLDRAGPAAQAGYLRLITSSQLTVVDLDPDGWARVSHLVETYTDLALDVIDASLIAAAEHHQVTTIATLDHRDFRVVRPTHVDAFELIPTPAR
jgi:uncharacterized protein